MNQTLYYTFLPMLDRLYTVATTELGLAYVGPDDGDLTELDYYFKNHTYIEDTQINNEAVAQLTEYINEQRHEFDLTLDLSHGTPFQQSVWHALLEIAYGDTTNYGTIASAIQNPKAIRAVGGAIGRNPISIIVPCHRVIGKNGKLTGYNGGLDVKVKLLDLESSSLTGESNQSD